MDYTTPHKLTSPFQNFNYLLKTIKFLQLLTGDISPFRMTGRTPKILLSFYYHYREAI